MQVAPESHKLFKPQPEKERTFTGGGREREREQTGEERRGEAREGKRKLSLYNNSVYCQNQVNYFFLSQTCMHNVPTNGRFDFFTL